MRKYGDSRRTVAKRCILCLFVIAGVIWSTGSFARNILVYNHASPNNTFPDPETGETVTPEDGICLALHNLGHAYTLVTTLPTSLADYDVVFVTLGWNC